MRCSYILIFVLLVLSVRLHGQTDAQLLAAIYQCEGGPSGNLGNRGAASLHDSRTDMDHVQFIRRAILSNQMVPTPHLIALCWVAGCARVFRHEETPAHRDYARRCINLLTSP